jgi:maltose O-acetyltransferase
MLRLAGIRVGSGVSVSAGLMVTDGVDIRIGDGSFMNRSVLIGAAGKVRIGERVYIGPRVSILTTTHEIGPATQRAGQQQDGRVSIADGCWIGAGTVILPGVDIAPGCVVAAGAVVTESTTEGGMYAGVPARLVRRLEKLPSSNRVVGQ